MAKYSEISFQTKKNMSNKLKELMNKKKSVSITRIVKDCSLNRNSFYYYFDNIYELIKWTYEQEVVYIIDEMNKKNDIEDAISFVLDYIDENRNFCIGTYNMLNDEQLKNMFKNIATNIIETSINNLLEINHLTIPDNYKNYLIVTHSDLLFTHINLYLFEPEKYDILKDPHKISQIFIKYLEVALTI